MESLVDIESVVPVSSFDGLVVWQEKNIPLYEIGNFLGSGVAGTVYEAEYVKSKKQYALKILNPLGYKILSPHQLKTCTVLVKGKPFSEISERNKDNVNKDHIWWLINGPTKQFHAAYYSERQRSLRELSLSQCIHVWGTEPVGLRDDGNDAVEVIQFSDGTSKVIPILPSKFSDFLRKRGRIFREIKNMRKVSCHPNVIRLESVLELTQESKCTIFLVMELANGGELFDRIKVDLGTREDTALLYFRQLLRGVRHCHQQGVCHRDLKPENLLLSDNQEQGPILKVADFGFSARVIAEYDSDYIDSWRLGGGGVGVGGISSNIGATPETPSFATSPVRQLISVVGSPFYVAPEVLQNRGYNGLKADIWSLGVILYAMLAGSLPFGQEHSSCKRFREFSSWVRNQKHFDFSRNIEHQRQLDYPTWLFPSHFSVLVKGLIVSMLHPDPNERISVEEAQDHPWCAEISSHLDRDDVKEEASLASSTRTPLRPRAMGEEGSQVTVEVDRPIDDSDVDECDVVSMGAMDDAFQLFGDMDGLDNPSPKRTGSGEETKSTAAASCSSSRRSSNAFIRPVSAADVLNEIADKSSACSPSVLANDLAQSYGSSCRPPVSQGFSSYGMDLLGSSDSEEESTVPTPRPSSNPPSFVDCVKRSTRFFTTVLATEVLDKVEHVLEECMDRKTATPIGIVTRIEVLRSVFRINVWSDHQIMDSSAPFLCAVQLYEISGTMPPAAMSPSHQPVPTFLSGDSKSDGIVSSPAAGRGSAHQPLFLVEFVRGQLDIFTFKKFYRWMRARVTQLVKKDYVFKLLDHTSSSAM